MSDIRGAMHSAKIARVGHGGYCVPSILSDVHCVTQETSLQEYYAASRDEEITTQLLEHM